MKKIKTYRVKAHKCEDKSGFTPYYFKSFKDALIFAQSNFYGLTYGFLDFPGSKHDVVLNEIEVVDIQELSEMLEYNFSEDEAERKKLEALNKLTPEERTLLGV